MIEVVLINQNLDGSIRDGPTEIVIRLNIDLDLVADAKRFFVSVFFRGLDGHFELGKFIFLQAEKSGVTDLMLTALVPEGDAIFAERQLFIQIKRTPGAAETIQRDFVLFYFRSAWVSDLKFDD